VLLLAVLLWAVRQRRWGVVGAFLLTTALLAGLCTAIIPSWPLHMLNAPRQSPPPTELYPWIGNTWFLLLRAVGAEGWRLWLAYLALAVPALVAVVWAALDRTRPLAQVLAGGLLAAFFVAPYARHYDFPVLAVPALALFATRLPRAAGVAVLAALVVVPYVQFVVLGRVKAAHDPGGKFLLECTFFWVPTLIAAAWLVGARALRPEVRPS
jgi:hypothetical protein